MTSRILLTAFILSPAVMVAALLYTIGAPPGMTAPPVGAGAGNTGGANAIGELLAGHRATHNIAHDDPSPAVERGQPEPKLVQPEELPQGFVVIVDDQAKRASQASPIYFASSINGWNPRDEKYRLTPQSDGKWRIILPAKPGGGLIEFKFTRGSWALEELDSSLNPIKNRYFPKVDVSKLEPGEQPRVEFTVPAWGDQRAQDPVLIAKDPYRDLKVTGTVQRLQVRGGAAGAQGSFRDALVWLPPGYSDPQNADRTYPVLYLQDGQNLFEKMPGTPDEWSADEAASKLVAAGEAEPFILVALPNSEEFRTAEYLPVPVLGDTPAGADKYIEFVVTQVKPRIDRAFRTRSGPESTGIGGSSLGALLALHAVATRSDVFGLLLAESPSLTAGDAQAWEQYIGAMKAFPKRAYLGVGGREYGQEQDKATKNRELVDAVVRLDLLLAKSGLDKSRRLLVVQESAEHNESAWKQRLPDALRFLFPPSMGDVAK